jgi:hypothetical protein
VSRPNNRVPSYSLHKASGQARIVIGGRSIYLGKYGSPESHEAYARAVTKFATEPADSPALKLHAVPGDDLSVNEVILRFLRHADTYYRWRGERTKEYRSYVEALRLLREMYGSAPAVEFGPKSLKLLQAASIEKGWCRRTINSRINRIRYCFKWAVSDEILPPSVYEALKTVPGLKLGRTAAVESKGNGPLPEAVIEAVLPFVAPQVAAMIQVQYHAAMRPGLGRTQSKKRGTV